MRATYLASIAHRRRRPFAHRVRYAATYRLLIPSAGLLARRGPVELTLRLAARWSRLAAITWRSAPRDAEGWMLDLGDQVDDLATTVTLALRERLRTRDRITARDLARLERITGTR